MKNLQKLLFLTLLLAGLCLPAFAGLDPADLLRDMEKVMRGDSHEMAVTMQIKTSSWMRNYKFHVWMQGVDKTFARVLAPAKVEGQGYLRLDTRLWNFIPTAERTILIPPSMMLDRFMGSDFSNDDFEKMSYLPRDYDASIQGRELIGENEVYHLILTPKKDAPVTYGKLKLLLRITDSAPVRMEFYNEQLEPIRTLHYSDFKNFKGHELPSVWKMEDIRDRTRETTITIQEAEFNQKISDKIFTQENLKKYP